MEVLAFMIRYATASDLPAILEIYNDAIKNTTAIYAYKPHSLEDRTIWYEQKLRDGFPLLVFEEGRRIAGYATYGPFRTYPAYKYTVEHSVYVHKDHRGKQIGTALMRELMKLADPRYVTMVAGIDASNAGSILMHKKLGFRECGTIRKAGYKFGKWLDLVFYEYHFPGPEALTED
jgi:Sortase and related acyltransferases